MFCIKVLFYVCLHGCNIFREGQKCYHSQGLKMQMDDLDLSICMHTSCDALFRQGWKRRPLLNQWPHLPEDMLFCSSKDTTCGTVAAMLLRF